MKKSDPSVAGSKRCESDNMKMMDARIAAGTEYFYGFSVYLPSTWELSEEEDILFQWKGFGGGPFMHLDQKHEGLFLGGDSIVIHAVFFMWDTVKFSISSNHIHTYRHTDKRTH